MIVVDTNVISYLHIEGEKAEHAEAVLAKDAGWVVPFLWRDEFRNVLALYLKRGILSLDDSAFLLGKAEQLLRGREHFVSGRTVLECVADTGLSAYDATFVALAQDFEHRLVSEDHSTRQNLNEPS